MQTHVLSSFLPSAGTSAEALAAPFKLAVCTSPEGKPEEIACS